jgi:carbonic anhydrase
MAHGRGRPDTAVVACADVDCDFLAWLRLSPHDVHLMTNAGGIVTDDTLSDLVRARTVLGVVRVVVVHHCPCGLMDLGEPARPEDAVDRLRASLARLLRRPLCLPAHAVHGVLGRAAGPLTRIDLPG